MKKLDHFIYHELPEVFKPNHLCDKSKGKVMDKNINRKSKEE